MAKKSKPYVRITGSGSSWVVVVAETRSPLSKIIEEIKFSSREAAYQCYRQIRKELGLGL